jgi:hypothetical protein
LALSSLNYEESRREINVTSRSIRDALLFRVNSLPPIHCTTTKWRTQYLGPRALCCLSLLLFGYQVCYDRKRPGQLPNGLPAQLNSSPGASRSPRNMQLRQQPATPGKLTMRQRRLSRNRHQTPSMTNPLSKTCPRVSLMSR